MPANSERDQLVHDVNLQVVNDFIIMRKSHDKSAPKHKETYIAQGR